MLWFSDTIAPPPTEKERDTMEFGGYIEFSSHNPAYFIKE